VRFWYVWYTDTVRRRFGGVRGTAALFG
jgi:hypothetical protein